MKAVATCVPHATCVKVTTELSPFCDLLVGWAPGRCWGGGLLSPSLWSLLCSPVSPSGSGGNDSSTLYSL